MEFPARRQNGFPKAFRPDIIGRKSKGIRQRNRHVERIHSLSRAFQEEMETIGGFYGVFLKNPIDPQRCMKSRPRLSSSIPQLHLLLIERIVRHNNIADPGQVENPPDVFGEVLLSKELPKRIQRRYVRIEFECLQDS